MVREIGKISEKPGDSRWYMFDSGKHTQVLVVRTLCQMDTEPQICEFGYGHGQYHAWPPKHSELVGIVGPTDASLNLARHHGSSH